MKKYCMVLFAVLLMLSACGSSKQDVTGDWIVDRYQFSDEEVSADNIVEYMGETFGAHNKDTLSFDSNGNANIVILDNSFSAKYENDDDSIKISDSEHAENLQIIDGEIVLKYSEDIKIIFKKK